MEGSLRTPHFRPVDSYVGDAVPFHFEDTWHVFFCKLRLDNSICLGHVTTNDFISWSTLPDAIENGPDASRDEFTCATGSVVQEAGGGFHLFYTGVGRAGSSILHAASKDLIHWIREDRVLIKGGPQWYRQDGLWRDPCVFWNPDEKNWWMAFCARTLYDSQNALTGAVGLAKSADLRRWELHPPLWAAGLTPWVECPDIFFMGGRWYLCWFWRDTLFRHADSLLGPWRRTRIEDPAGFDFFAGKSATDGQRRLLFGWIPRMDSDGAARTWGGDLAIPRELQAQADGAISVTCPAEVLSAYAEDATRGRGAAVFSPLAGSWQLEGSQVKTDATGRGNLALWAECPPDFLLEFTLTLAGGSGVFSLVLRSGRATFANGPGITAMDLGYELRFDAFENSLAVREHSEYGQKPDIASASCEIPAQGGLRVLIILHKDLLEAFLGTQRSLECRLLRHKRGGLGLLARDATVQLTGFQARVLG